MKTQDYAYLQTFESETCAHLKVPKLQHFPLGGEQFENNTKMGLRRALEIWATLGALAQN